MAEGSAKTIDLLPEKKSLTDGDMFPIDDGAQTYRVLWSTILKQAGGIKTVKEGTGTISITLNDGTAFTITTSDPSKQPLLTWDSAPTSGSANPVTSDGIYKAIDEVSSELNQTGERIEANSAAIADEAKRAKAAEAANAKAIEILNGDKETVGSVAHTTAEALAELVAGAPESLDTLKEIAAWIEGHSDDAATMNKNIKANTQAIADEEKRAKAAESSITERLDALGLYVDEDGDICQR